MRRLARARIACELLVHNTHPLHVSAPVCRLRSPGRGAGRGRRGTRPVATGHGHRPSTEARRGAGCVV